MRFSTAVVFVAGAATAAAQISLPSTIPILGFPFGQQCQGAVLQALTNSSFGQCFPTADLLPLLSSNGSIIPVLDLFMSDLCYRQPCSTAALQAAAQAITAGCASDIAAAKLPNNTVSIAFSAYPVLREVLCLKTSDPYTAQSYGGFLGPAPIPIATGGYNATNGTFCVTSVLTQYSAYLGANITVPYIATAIAGGNATAVARVKATNLNVICNPCIFAAVGIIEAAVPALGQIPLATLAAYVGMTISDKQVTLNSLMNSTCAYKPLVVSSTMLPTNITVSIVNSTFSPRLAPASA